MAYGGWTGRVSGAKEDIATSMDLGINHHKLDLLNKIAQGFSYKIPCFTLINSF